MQKTVHARVSAALAMLVAKICLIFRSSRVIASGRSRRRTFSAPAPPKLSCQALVSHADIQVAFCCLVARRVLRFSLSRGYRAAMAYAVYSIAFATSTMALADASPPLMTIPGKFGVGPTGAALYSVPISIPPGTAGLAPALSLNYSSQNSDGVVGLRWTIGGLPAISRCPRTIAQDGVHGGVNYDSNDRFCLDGQRLILVSGTYGSDGSQYRTEIDTFAKVIAHGTAGNGPAWFELHNKSGQIEELGHT
jgi:hypothetical protein